MSRSTDRRPRVITDELRAFAKEHLPGFAAPRRLELVASLPRTPLGKVRLADLGPPPPGSPPAS